jgi:hypothetical protein
MRFEFSAGANPACSAVTWRSPFPVLHQSRRGSGYCGGGLYVLNRTALRAPFAYALMGLRHIFLRGSRLAKG